MTAPDVFALSNSPVNRFLFSEVGLEPSGVPLTVLSVLARLGEDPWRQAQNWSTLPEKTVIDQLTERIQQMPMAPQALQDARLTAKRLTLLLPAQRTLLPTGKLESGRMPRWNNRTRMTILIAGLGIGIAINAVLFSSHFASVDAAPGPDAVAQPLTGTAMHRR